MVSGRVCGKDFITVGRGGGEYYGTGEWTEEEVSWIVVDCIDINDQWSERDLRDFRSRDKWWNEGLLTVRMYSTSFFMSSLFTRIKFL